MALPPSVSSLHFGFWFLRLVPTPTSVGLRFVFPFEYLHRLHYDSMIGPALAYPRVSHGSWTYGPHAQGCTLSSTIFYFGVGISCLHFWICLLLLLWSWYLFCLPFWFCLLLLHLYLSWYLFCLHFEFLHFPSALVAISSALLSVNVSFCRFSLGPSFSYPSLSTRCGGIYSLISLFRIAAFSTPLSWSFGMNFVIIRRPPCGLHIRLSRLGSCGVEYTNQAIEKVG